MGGAHVSVARLAYCVEISLWPPTTACSSSASRTLLSIWRWRGIIVDFGDELAACGSFHGSKPFRLPWDKPTPTTFSPWSLTTISSRRRASPRSGTDRHTTLWFNCAVEPDDVGWSCRATGSQRARKRLFFYVKVWACGEPVKKCRRPELG